jgi:glyoxylase-like metal-dependent hydrolase (beta-lactamase superfamily II)
MILECIEVGEFQVNCYVLAEGRGLAAAIIDPGQDEDGIREILAKYSLKPGLVINTHGHIDHIGCDDRFGVPIYVHQEDLKLLRDPQLNLSGFLMPPYSVDKAAKIEVLKDKDIINFGKLPLEVIHTPGHTPGGICLLLESGKNKILFTGDSLFYRSIGRTDFPGASEKLLVSSLKEKLLKLSGDTIIYPGHGPSSTIGDEIKENPFLN